MSKLLRGLALAAVTMLASGAGLPPASGDPAADTRVLQQAFDTAGIVRIPAGIYRTDRTLLIASGVSVECEPGAIIRPVSLQEFPREQLFVVSNRPGAENITITGCTVDATDWRGAPGHHAFFFQSAKRIRVIRPNCPNGPGDCTAMVHTRDTLVENGTAANMRNACWDHWGSSVNMTVVGGTCDSRLYGALITGTNTTASDDGHTFDGTIEGGTYHISYARNSAKDPPSGGAAIWINGLGKSGSGSSNIRIIAPKISLSGSTTTGIKVSGAGTDVTIENPVISGTTMNSAIITGADSGGTPKRTIIKGARLMGVQVGHRPLISLNGDDDTIHDTVVQGGVYSVKEHFGKQRPSPN